MIQLESNGLQVSILDPVADRARLGSRYVCGGYIWQVTDRVKGELLSGPAYPKEPPPFDGQGLPEVFEIALGQHLAKVGEEVFVIGVGRVRRESPVKPFHVRNNRTTLEFSPWQVTKGNAEVTMISEQAFKEWALRITRRVSLEGRTVVSATQVVNRGGAELPLRWFAHPFFPHAGSSGPGLECCGFSQEASFVNYLPENGGFGGFQWNDRGYLERKASFDWTQGCFQLLNLPFGAPLTATVRHPLLGEVGVECRFPLAWLPIWANENTFSFEPYHHTVLPPGGVSEWSIRYGF
jgi:hypothetical protein